MTHRLSAELRDSDLFGALSPPDRERLRSLFHHRSFRSGQVIFLKGDQGFGLYLIRSGRVKISVVDRDGTELIFTYLSSGDLLGDIAILDGRPRSATAIATEDTAMLYLERGEFLSFLRSSPQACIDIIGMLCQRLRRVSRQLEELSFLDVAGRIARKLIDSVSEPSAGASGSRRSATLAITQEELASVIGASRIMVNKVLNSFVELGLISTARKRLTVLDATGLNRIASYDGDE